LMGKILEEAGIELPNAWHDLERGRVDNQTEFRGEAGDALWCTVALASNAGVDVSEAVRQHLRTQYLHPEPRGPITFGRLQVALVDHVPTHGTDPRFLPEDADYEDYLPDVRDYLMWFSVTASMDLARQYGYGDYADARTLRQYLHELTNTTGPLAKDILGQWATILDEATGQPGVLEIRDKITTSYFREISDKYTVPLIGQAVVFLEHTVKGQGVSLGQIAVDNMRKLTGRVATNTVDKQDGPR
jgi:NTP pyrophosphatase (non-canonical NTP hydrolase)